MIVPRDTDNSKRDAGNINVLPEKVVEQFKDDQ